MEGQTGPKMEGFDEKTGLPARTGEAGVPAALGDFVDAGTAGAGFEDMGMGDQITPFLRILQTNSPQVDQAHADYVPGALGGMLYDTATQSCFDSLMRPNAPGAFGVQLIICFAERGFGVWLPRDLDGGFRGMLTPTDDFVLHALRTWGTKFNFPRYRKETGWTSRGKKLELHDRPDQKVPLRFHDEDVELIETINYYVLYSPGDEEISAENARRAIVRFSSTSFSIAQGVNTKMNSWTYPVSVPDGQGGMRSARLPASIWQYRWRVRTIAQSKGNNSWYNYHFSLSPPDAKPPFDFKAMIPKSDPLFELGRDFYELAKGGGVKVQDVKGDHGDEDADGGPEIPF